MNLSELYKKGKETLLEREIGIFLKGVETEFVLRNNRHIMDKYTFKQHAIDAVPEPDTTVEVLGLTLGTPVIMSAMTMPITAITEEGLFKVARGLKEAGSLMWTGSPIPKELKALKETGVPLAANVKPLKERKKMFEALEEIQAAGVDWVGVEVDSGMGTKILDKQMVFNCAPLTTAELKEIRKIVQKPLILKGILSGGDAAKALDVGADGIIVSNHGAHTLDYLPHPFQVMDEIVDRVGGKIVIMADGGFRRGSDVLKGLALGATLIGLGRPILYGLAADGQSGVRDVILSITGEMKRIMALTGAPDVQHVGRNILIG